MDIKDEQELIKKRASRDMVILLESWKRRKRKQRIYRYSLLGAMTLSILALLGIGYLQLDQKIPSIIRLKAGAEQILDWEVPMTAEVVAVSEQGESNISDKSITMNLGNTVKLIPGSADSYQMDVKLFGWIPFKQVNIQVIEEQELIPVGVPVGIYVETDGILVVGVGETYVVKHNAAAFYLGIGWAIGDGWLCFQYFVDTVDACSTHYKLYRNKANHHHATQDLCGVAHHCGKCACCHCAFGNLCTTNKYQSNNCAVHNATCQRVHQNHDAFRLELVLTNVFGSNLILVLFELVTNKRLYNTDCCQVFLHASVHFVVLLEHGFEVWMNLGCQDTHYQTKQWHRKDKHPSHVWLV